MQPLRSRIALLVARGLERFIDLQIRAPWMFVALTLVAAFAAGSLVPRMELRTRYEALLPDNQPSVRALERIRARTEAVQTVFIVLEGDRVANRALADALCRELVALGPEVVTSAQSGIHEARAFLSPRAAFFLSTAQLKRITDAVRARWEHAVAHATGFSVETDPPPPLPTVEDLATVARDDELRRFPDGYFERSDGTASVVVVRSPVAGGDLARIEAALRTMDETIRRVRAELNLDRVRVSYAGDMPTGFAEYGVVVKDLVEVGVVGLTLVLAAVFGYFLRIRALLVMAITIFVGLAWTFGLTQLVIGHLNVATAFLVSIVAGNGINAGILYQSRYFEERASGRAVDDAVRVAVRSTWKPTAIAAFAAAASYGSLLVTDFRAFRDFGFIAAVGMLLCWLAKTLLVPPLLVLMEDRHGRHGALRRTRRGEMGYGLPFALLTRVAPTVWATAGALVIVGGAVAAVAFVRNDPLEYDMRRVENDPASRRELQRAWDISNSILGGSQGPMVLVADSGDDAREAVDVLRDRYDAAPPGAKPFVAVRSLWDLVARDQGEKVGMVRELGELLRRARQRQAVSDEEWAALAPFVPPEDVATYSERDIPASVAGPFSDRFGTRGTVLLVELAPGVSDDLRSMVASADALRTVPVAEGRVVEGSGSVVIFADMLKAVVRDVPRSLLLSLVFTLVAVFVAFREPAALVAVLGAFTVGLGGVALYMYGSGIRIHFLNFAALPVTFGIGVEYAINVVQRYRADRARGILHAIHTSGGAVALCSLTTMLGYVALLRSQNQAIRSLGSVAAVGELSCALAALLVLPSVCLLIERRRARPGLAESLREVT